MDVQEQQVEESEKDQFRTVMKHHSKEAFEICTKKCITNFKSKELSDKEKMCISKCFDRKVETFFVAMNTLNTFTAASQKKQSETSGFSSGFA